MTALIANHPVESHSFIVAEDQELALDDVFGEVTVHLRIKVSSRGESRYAWRTEGDTIHVDFTGITSPIGVNAALDDVLRISGGTISVRIHVAESGGLFFVHAQMLFSSNRNGQ
jgi:hypothetical protein